MTKPELCTFLWVDIMGQTHVCDQPEATLHKHYCHCSTEYEEGDDAQDM